MSRALCAPEAAGDPAPPLCVDLDGTLILTNSLVETAFSSVFRNPWVAFRLPAWLIAGRATLKRELAVHGKLNAALLPYNKELVDYLRHEKSRGRRLALVTAADGHIARAVAEHLGLFDDVMASEGERDLKGEAKAEALLERFGQRGFSYVGNDKSDLKVWEQAAGSVTVNASPSFATKVAARAPLEHKIENPSSLAGAILRALRPYHWSKNLLIFVPILTSGAFLEAGDWMTAALLFVAFSLAASGIYVANDLHDLEADRAHPRKRDRPFARGDLPVLAGAAAAPLLLLAGLAIGAALDAAFYILSYAILSLMYSIRLKVFPLVDVFALAALYSVRLFAGGEVTGHPVSMWLLAFSGFLFLSLALIKRVAELKASEARKLPRRGYWPRDIEVLQQMGLAASFVSAAVLALYVQSDWVSAQYARPSLLWMIVPLFTFWQCRMWLSTARGHMLDDPIVYAAKDWVSWLSFACIAAVLVAAYLT